MFANILNFSSCNFKINMHKNSVKYLQGINFSQLTISEKTEINNCGCVTPALVSFICSTSCIVVAIITNENQETAQMIYIFSSRDRYSTITQCTH